MPQDSRSVVPSCLRVSTRTSLVRQLNDSLRGILAVSALSLAAALPLHASTTVDADTLTNAYNSAFFSLSGSNGSYANDTTGGGMGFWTGAEEIEMLEDAYDRSNSSTYKTMITELINGFVAKNGSNWSGNKFNDDILWAVIACSRGYQITGNTTFKSLAKTNFDVVYSRGYDTVLGGGIWWNTDKGSKNACDNGPAIIAACYIYTMYNDSTYLTKAQSIYSWERATLFNTTTGNVRDHINADGTISYTGLTYNEGTFIGAANYLYTITGTAQYLSDAQLGASYTQTNLCDANGIMPQYSTTGDLSGFNGIFIRWLGRFAKDRGLWDNYYDWMYANATAAWSVRRSDNLSWDQWNTATASGTLQSWACSDSVVMLNVIPPQFEAENLTEQASSGDTWRDVTDANMAAGAGSILDATAAGDYVTLVMPNVSARKYDVRIGTKKLNTRGIVQVAISQAGNNSPANVGAPQDLYSASAEYDELDLGSWQPSTNSDKWVRFTVTGKNASSTGYSLCVDYIKLIPQ